MQHKFKIQMYEFSCENLVAPDKCEPFLKIDFDNSKIFKTDHEQKTHNPEWGFKAGFQYHQNYLERLSRRMLRVQCFNKTSNSLIGEAGVDLQTIACGPAYFRLTLRDPATQESRGIVKFMCVMKMVSHNVTILCKDLALTMQGSAAPAQLHISSTLDDDNNVTVVPHSQEGLWSGPHSYVLETSLADLLKAPAYECLRFDVIDNSGQRQGQALLPFRTAFSPTVDTSIPFKVSVTYSCVVDGEEMSEPMGAVGELSGVLFFQNLPVYAQMAGGLYSDGQVEGGFWLFEGLPYPHALQQPPPLWLDPTDRVTEARAREQPCEDSEKLHDLDDEKFLEALDEIDLPPPWEKRRDRGGERGGGRVYFADPRSRRTTWKDPRFVPENWDQRIDPTTGKVCFQYHKTRQSTAQDPRGCPPGWDMRLSKTGEVYFAHLPSMQTTFIDPRGLPEAVDPALDDKGRLYFKNHTTKTTSWEDPRAGQQEVTLTKWRQVQASRWLKDQVLREIEELQRQRLHRDREDDDAEASREL